MSRNTTFLPLLLLSGFFLCGSLSTAQAMPSFDAIKPPSQPNYAQENGWLAKPTKATKDVDVFYVYPTVLFNKTDWMMDINKADMRTAAKGALDTQASVFEGQANIYAPMYRQMNIAGFTALKGEQSDQLLKIAQDDVWNAFLYYLKYENKGRPFFLAGHSQGSIMLTDLMREHWGDLGVEKQMIAAYLIGWSLTPDDIKKNPKLKLCEQAKETGCIISYNAMADGSQSKSPTLAPHTFAVNPLSWTTDGKFVSKEKNEGAVFFDKENKPTTYPHFASAQIIKGGLIVQPEQVELVTVSGGFLPAGIYHSFDYSLFFNNLKNNIATRLNSYKTK